MDRFPRPTFTPTRIACTNVLVAFDVPTQLDERSTRWLARAAFDDGAISDVAFDFIDDEPARADEVLEFTRWLASEVQS